MSSSPGTVSQQANPYAPPTAPLGDEPRGSLLGFGPASKPQRLVDFMVDWVMMCVVFFVIGIVLALLGYGEVVSEVPDVVYGVCGMLLYYLPLEALGGRTIGKLLTGTRVVTETGGAPSLGQVLARTLMRMVPFEPLSFLGSSSSGWHDTVSHTQVVRVRRSFLDTPAAHAASDR